MFLAKLNRRLIDVEVHLLGVLVYNQHCNVISITQTGTKYIKIRITQLNNDNALMAASKNFQNLLKIIENIVKYDKMCA